MHSLLWHTHSAAHYSICLPYSVTCWAPSYMMAMSWELSMGSNFHLLPHRALPHMEPSHQEESALLWKTGPLFSKRFPSDKKSSKGSRWGLLTNYLLPLPQPSLATPGPPTNPGSCGFHCGNEDKGTGFKSTRMGIRYLSYLLVLATNDLCGTRKLPSVSSCVTWMLRTWWPKTPSRIIIPLFIPDICMFLWLQRNNHPPDIYYCTVIDLRNQRRDKAMIWSKPQNKMVAEMEMKSSDSKPLGACPIPCCSDLI